MNSSLRSDLQRFVYSRLDYVSSNLRANSEYMNGEHRAQELTAALQASLNTEQLKALLALDDCNLDLLNFRENACYRQGFKDALRLLDVL